MRRLFVLRPEPGNGETVRRAEALGLDAEAMPLFKIEPVEWEAPDGGAFDGLLLTSANAVVNAGDQLSRLRGLPAFAVGEATAEAARGAGFDVAAMGDSGVDRLLGSIEPDLRLLHLAGEQSRDATGARQHITSVIVYRASPLPAPKELPSLSGQVAAIHSPRAGERLAELARQCSLRTATVRLACISKAAAEAAGEGWEDKQWPDSPRDEALLALASRLCDKPRHE